MVKKQEKFCANHMNVVATETCSECGKNICYNCKIEAFNRIFCSFQCIVVAIAKAIAQGIFLFLKYFFKGLFFPFRFLLKRSLRGFIEIIMFLGLLSCFFFLWKMSKQIKRLESTAPIKISGAMEIDTTKLLPPTLITPTRDGMVFSNKVSFEGKAEKDRIIALSIDGEIKKVLLPENGSFELKDVHLHRGNNTIQIRTITHDGEVTILQTMSLSFASPSHAFLARDFQRGSLKKKQIALTFDGGASNNASDEILDILKDKKVKATFFLTGEFIRKYPKTVRRIVSEGGQVGNHTWSHPHFTSFAENFKHETLPGITAKKLQDELSKTASLFKMVTGENMSTLWRAPYGEYNKEILSWAAQAGYKHIGWTATGGWEGTMDTMDWVADKNSKAYHTAEEIVEKILNYGNGKKSGINGSVILMHLGTNRKDDFPHQKLPEIIDGLREKGYELVAVSEMITK